MGDRFCITHIDDIVMYVFINAQPTVVPSVCATMSILAPPNTKPAVQWAGGELQGGAAGPVQGPWGASQDGQAQAPHLPQVRPYHCFHAKFMRPRDLLHQIALLVLTSAGMKITFVDCFCALSLPHAFISASRTQACQAKGWLTLLGGHLRRDITINIGKGVPVPQPGAPYEGHKWKEVPILHTPWLLHDPFFILTIVYRNVSRVNW